MVAADDTEVVLTTRIPLPQNYNKEILLVTLNRPEKKNCFNTQLCHKLATIFHDAANEIQNYDTNPIHDDDDTDNDSEQKLVAIIITGAGRSFCAGADLSNPPNPLHQSMDLPHHLRWNPVHQMERVGVPIIGVLRGHVITGGFELALACDILLGDATTTFRDTHVKFGLAPCWGLSQKLSRRIGPGRAKIVSFSAQPVRATQAHEWGLLDELIKGDTESSSSTKKTKDGQTDNPVLDRAIELADAVASNNSLMVRRYKRAMVEGNGMEYRKGLQRERELGLAHYMEVVGDGQTFEEAKEFIADDGRSRSQSKL
mmetsp:Transcript_7762/g.14055  ORF Transcript_7762/g.14055 Transcript_7762/m.14055 type:complete len:314 (-) Transcript_7762:146-1087(-)|eukprot:CAMPEP_0201606156 /NCGR_PEP_ID=MMETSP0492-20130828/5715_1 /ASSEMBLY_ACC=CAM_ASM_000837 /TAXON_ID=420259 /ORGANISM="Thalassiosira gravida, Strain GMp14c1" /LENGTH=313 /DNA_ID=CAMNT_0048070515 /DNA_START=90 /DNA_END=1031 /DNA_ORIENTATION=+